jgi:hypothetical protein
MVEGRQDREDKSVGLRYISTTCLTTSAAMKEIAGSYIDIATYDATCKTGIGCKYTCAYTPPLFETFHPSKTVNFQRR